MVDITELSGDVVRYQSQGRHGMAMLARYQFRRNLSAVTEIDREILDYFDKLADALLNADAAGLAIRDVVHKPELGLARAGRGRPKTDPKLQHFTEDHKKQKGYHAALYRAELFDSGLSSTKADSDTCEVFGYKDQKSVQNASSTYKIAVENEMKLRTAFRHWADMNKDYIELYSLERELRSACLAIDKSTPQTKLTLLSERSDRAAAVVTFPPSKVSLRKRLTTLTEEDTVQEIGAICIAAETGENIDGMKRVDRDWPICDMKSFATAVLAHLKQCGVGR